MRDSPAFDDEDLWFPAHMSAGDSFSRPLTAAGAAAEDDGIGLPRRRPAASAGTRRRTPKTSGVKASSWLWLTLWGAAALGIAAYAARKELATEWTEGWLTGQGVPAQLHFDRLSPGHASGHFVLGRPGHPDLSAGHFDADLDLNPFAGGGQPLARVKTLRLDQAFLHLSYKDGKLSFGTLDRLAHLPSGPKAVIVSDAAVAIDTDYGTLTGRGAAALRDGRLSYLSLKWPAARLDGAQGGGDFGGGEVLVRGASENALQVEARLNAAQFDLRDGRRMVEGAPAQPVHVQGLSIDVSGHVPYRDDGALSGPIDATVDVTARGLRAQGVTVADADGHVKLNGRLRGGAQYDGAADVAARAGHVSGRGIDARQVAVEADGLDLHTAGPSLKVTGAIKAGAGRLARRGVTVGAARLEARHFALTADAEGSHTDFDGTMAAGDMRAGDLDFSHAEAPLDGTLDTHSDVGAWSLKARGALNTDGGYGGLRASLHARRISLLAGGRDGHAGDASVWISAPAEADLAGGGTLTVTPLAGKPLLAGKGVGGFDLTLTGAGARGALHVDNLAMAPNGTLTGDYDLDGPFSRAPLAGARISARGRFSAAGGLSATLAQPLSFTAQSADLGATFTHISGTLGRAGDTWLHADASGWRVKGAFGALAMDAPGAQLALRGGQGTVSIGGGDVDVELDAASLDDMSAGARRFRPLVLSGALTRNGRVLSGRFTAAANVKAAGRPTPVLTIALDETAGKGQLSLHAQGLDFAPGGLQPGDLSPQAATLLGDQVSGIVGFDGAYRWDGRKAASSGVVRLDGLSFGPASHLHGTIDFTSLSPLLSRPDQVLGVDRLDIGLPLSGVALHLQVRGDRVAIDPATADTAGGPVRLEPMTVAFDANAPVRGAVAFDGLDFGKIVAASRLSDRLTFEGRLSGRVPFAILDGHVAFADGWIKADGPGELSIQRQALSGLTAGGAVSMDGQTRAAAVPAGSDPFPDLAYQALAHLHYDQLDATLTSRPGEAPDARIHLTGRFAPPRPQKARMSLDDYLDGAWAKKPLALPSDTPVDLYLDALVRGATQ